METLILRIILCSTVLLGCYHLFLAKERTFKFNRMYLIVALVFSYCVPFIPVKSIAIAPNNPSLIIGQPLPSLMQSSMKTSESFDWSNLFLIIYLAVSFLFFMKFAYSFYKIKSIKGKKKIYQNQHIIVLDKDIAPFSFLDTMYFGKKYFINNHIDERIFLHEKCHINQKHTFDLLFIEFLKIFSWFNPALYFYTHAMITNHEFLADAFVIENKNNIRIYQQLILNEINTSRSFHLTHKFDFNNTKKRFIMMTTKTSRFAAAKKAAALPLLAILFVFFSKNIYLQAETITGNSNSVVRSGKQDITIPGTQNKARVADKKLVPAVENTQNEYKLKNDTVKKKKNFEVETSAISTQETSTNEKFNGILPQFPRGINAFRTLISQNFDTSVFKGNEGIVKTKLFIEIDENGKVTNVTSEGDNEIFNKETVRSVYSTKNQTWTPATENGKAVKYILKFPMTMAFAGSNSEM